MGGAVVSEHADISADPTDARHGTRVGYTTLECRCERCCEANTLWHREYRRRPIVRLAEAEQEIKRLQTELALTQAWAAITDNNLQWAYEWLRRDVPAFVEHEKKMTAEQAYWDGPDGRAALEEFRRELGAHDRAAATTEGTPS